MPYYTLVDFPKEGDTYGEYEGKTPKAAANKILTILARKVKLNNSNNNSNHNKFIVFIIRNKKTNKEYKYIGTRIKLNNSNNNSNHNKFIVFIIRNKKTNKEYKYIGTRIKLNKPKVVYYNGKEVKHFYKNIVTQYDDYLMKNN